MNVIVAEDNPATLKMLEKALAQNGYQVFAAQNGLDAWELIKQKKARIIISDWMMPHLSGPELCRKIRSAEFTEYFYIIILTARDEADDVLQGLEAGADDFITKPFNADEVLARVRSGKRIVDLEEKQNRIMLQLYQSDKMTSIGQLAAGVAHEINNPVGFVHSNISTLTEYLAALRKLVGQYQDLTARLDNTEKNTALPLPIKQKTEEIRKYEEEIDVKYVLDDLEALIDDCREGVDRIKKIVFDLKEFSRPGKDEPRWTDIHQNLNSTLSVMRNAIKYKARVTTDYGDIPVVKCFPQQMNQAFLNILINAVQSIEGDDGEIKVVTKQPGNGCIEIGIEDSGVGIAEAHLPRIFDPFFTTKDIGSGVGMGLNVAYNIIKEHGGTIDVRSRVGKGTTVTVRIPVNHAEIERA